MGLSNQYPTILYGLTSGGGLLPIGTLNVNSAGQVIFTTSSGTTPGSFLSIYNSVSDLQAIVTLGVVGILNSIISAMNTPTAGKLSYYQLRNDANGDYLPNDYSLINNNVSWYSVL